MGSLDVDQSDRAVAFFLARRLATIPSGSLRSHFRHIKCVVTARYKNDRIMLKDQHDSNHSLIKSREYIASISTYDNQNRIDRAIYTSSVMTFFVAFSFIVVCNYPAMTTLNLLLIIHDLCLDDDMTFLVMTSESID